MRRPMPIQRKLGFRIRKSLRWEAAHMLEGLPPTHPCSNMHGHSYRAEVTARAENLDKVGFVLDFNLIKEIQKKLDHTLLNEIMPDRNPTAENIALFIYETLNMIILHLGEQDDVIVEKVCVWETETCYAEVEMHQTLVEPPAREPRG
jgi:6-pyruvoyltetrahydropterin/6-carboxytetrahydropterin synthase